MAVASVVLAGAQEKPPVANGAAQGGDDAKPMVDAIAAIGSVIAGAGQGARAELPAVAEGATPGAEEAPAASRAPRSAKNSVVLVTGGAAAGAAIGAALGKNSKSAMIGAAVGGVAGLIYDRLTYKSPGAI